MYRHGGTCLAGPVSQARVWWICPAGDTETPAEGIRHDLVARVRREIAEGTYDTSDKWDIALARLVYRLEQ